MVVRKLKRNVKNNAGQSTIEILIAFPLFLALVGLTIKVNQAIQISIVNQKYARAQALRLANNSPVYPELKFRTPPRNDFSDGTIDRMIIGMSNDIPTQATGVYRPEASSQRINRQGKDNTPDNVQEEPSLRGNVRVRTTVALCTQYNGPITDDGNFSYCRSNLR